MSRSNKDKLRQLRKFMQQIKNGSKAETPQNLKVTSTIPNHTPTYLYCLYQQLFKSTNVSIPMLDAVNSDFAYFQKNLILLHNISKGYYREVATNEYFQHLINKGALLFNLGSVGDKASRKLFTKIYGGLINRQLTKDMCDPVDIISNNLCDLLEVKLMAVLRVAYPEPKGQAQRQEDYVKQLNNKLTILLDEIYQQFSQLSDFFAHHKYLDVSSVACKKLIVSFIKIALATKLPLQSQLNMTYWSEYQKIVEYAQDLFVEHLNLVLYIKCNPVAQYFKFVQCSFDVTLNSVLGDVKALKDEVTQVEEASPKLATDVNEYIQSMSKNLRQLQPNGICIGRLTRTVSAQSPRIGADKTMHVRLTRTRAETLSPLSMSVGLDAL